MDNFDYSIEGADIEYDDGNNPTQIDLLFRAAKTGRFDDFKTTLFSSKLRLNVQDGLGNTALHYAAAGDHPRIAHFILKTDPKVINISNNIGDTPLHKVKKLITKCTQALFLFIFFFFYKRLLDVQNLKLFVF